LRGVRSTPKQSLPALVEIASLAMTANSETPG